MKWLTGHQPNYLPYPGFFSKILRADAFVIVDHVQFRRKSDHKRNTIHGPNGPFNLSLQTSAPYQARLCEISLVEPKKILCEHWKSIRNCYGKYPYFQTCGGELEAIYARDYVKMADLNEAIIRYLLKILDIDKPVYKSSEFVTDGELKNNDMIIFMCRHLGCDGYISGMGAVDYILPEKFAANGLQHRFNAYQPIAYETPRGPSIPNMSVIDPIFAIGPQKTRQLLQAQFSM